MPPEEAGSDKRDLSGHSFVPMQLVQAVQQPSPALQLFFQPSSWECQKSRELGSATTPGARPARALKSRSAACWALLGPVPAALSLPAGLGAGHSSVGSSRELPALGETSGRLLRNCRRMGTACHSPNDCHSLIISGQRGWQHSLALSNFATAVVAVGAKHRNGAQELRVAQEGTRRDAELRVGGVWDMGLLSIHHITLGSPLGGHGKWAVIGPRDSEGLWDAGPFPPGRQAVPGPQDAALQVVRDEGCCAGHYPARCPQLPSAGMEDEQCPDHEMLLCSLPASPTWCHSEGRTNHTSGLSKEFLELREGPKGDCGARPWPDLIHLCPEAQVTAPRQPGDLQQISLWCLVSLGRPASGCWGQGGVGFGTT